MRRATLGLIALGVIAVDRGTKLLADSMDLAVPHQLIGSLLQIIRGENRGGLFGLLQGSAPLLALLSIGVVVALVIFHEREHVSRVTPLTVGIGLLIGGAIGNLLDRLAFGYVLDFIDIGIGSLRFWTFNIADAGISLGIVILLVDTLWRSRSTVRT
ncbi:MAG: signal peptidase II [Candidatus Aquidulcis sp.]|nr:MAG: signal peptidase II [Candidatus Aquidulcis sp.]